MKRPPFSLILLLLALIRGYASDSLDQWQSRNPLPQGNRLGGIAYGNNQFVAGGWYGPVTSPDGITWTSRTSGTSNPLYRIAYGNNQFVAVTGFGGTIVTSPDGITWTSRASTGNFLSAIAYENNQFVAVGSGTTVTSPDGSPGPAALREPTTGWAVSLMATTSLWPWVTMVRSWNRGRLE
ncbi:MAG: beta propeller repeat protein [Limisphaerales bacterium]